MKTIICTLILSLVSFYSNGQFLRKLKKAAERGAERAVERQVEKEVQKVTERQVEKAFEGFYGPEEIDANNNKKGGSFMKSLNFNVSTADQYSFTGSADMVVTSTDDKGKANDPVKMKSYLADDASYTAMEMNDESKKQQGQVVMIFDFEKSVSIMLMENEGEKSSFAFGFEDAISDSMMDSIPDTELRKTGNTKNIIGYSCEEYILEDEDYIAHYWISENPIEGISSLWSKNSKFLSKKFKSKNSDYFSKLPDGNILEMNYKDKENESTSNMLVTGLSPNEKVTFIMDDYPNAYSAQASEN